MFEKVNLQSATGFEYAKIVQMFEKVNLQSAI